MARSQSRRPGRRSATLVGFARGGTAGSAGRGSARGEPAGGLRGGPQPLGVARGSAVMRHFHAPAAVPG